MTPACRDADWRRGWVPTHILDAVVCPDLLCAPEADDAHRFLHLRTLSRDNRGKLRGGPVLRVDTGLLQALHGRGVGENRRHCRRNPVTSCLVHPAPAEQSSERVVAQLLETCLGDGRHLRQGRGARARRNGEGAYLALADAPEEWRER